MDLFAFRKPKNELESDEGESKNVPFVPEEMWDKMPQMQHYAPYDGYGGKSSCLHKVQPPFQNERKRSS